MARAAAINLSTTWNSISVEERLELVSRAKGEGSIAAIAAFFLCGAVAYGFDQVSLLILSVATALIVMPLFASHRWRRGKSEMILSYLAARSIARRFAYGYRIGNLDLQLLFRGTLLERVASDSAKAEYVVQEVSFESSAERRQDTWICLLRGGIVVLSERRGGAKLEFITPITHHTVVRKPERQDNIPENFLIIETPEKKVAMLSSPYPGALYVFEKRLAKLIFEANEAKRALDETKRKMLEDEQRQAAA